MLKGLKVLEFGQFISAAFCTKMLADLGAEVIKVEPPEKGDCSRYYGPFPGDEAHPERSGLFLFLNHNKLGITLDVEQRQGREALLRLIRGSDILVENYPLPKMSNLDLDYATTSKINPSLIHCAITPFGWKGPYRDLPGSSIHCCALSGASWAIGSPDREPLEIPLHQSDYQAGINAAAAIMVALRYRQLKGTGQHIDISASDVMATYVGTNAILYIFYGLQWYRAGRRAYGSGGPYPYGVFPCKDGHVCLIARTPQDWDRLLKALGSPEWSKNPRYWDQIRMGREYPDEVDALLIPILRKYTQAKLFQMAQEWGFPLAPVRNMAQALKEPQLAERNLFGRVDHQEAGRLIFLRPPYQFSDYRPELPRPAPLLGEHNDLIQRSRLGFSQEKIPELKVDRATTKRGSKGLPLAGLRVLDLSWVWSGPMVGSIMADFGAEVIKIEHSERLDNTRLRGKPVVKGRKIEGKSIELGPYFHNLNRNKLSITLNLKTRKGAQLFKDLIKKSDILIENFTTNTLPKLGLGYEDLNKVRPELVMLSLPGAGQSGSLSDLRAYAPVLSSLAGLEYMVGYEGEPPLGMMNLGLSDPNAATQGLFAVMVGLYHREITGRGTYIDMSQLEASLACLGEAIMEYEMNGRLLGPRGNFHRSQAPYGIYPCKGEDTWVAISVDSEEEWEGFVRALGNPDWAENHRFASKEGRLKNRKMLDAKLKEWTSGLVREGVLSKLRAEGVAATPVLSIEEQYEDEHFRERGIHQRVMHPILGEVTFFSVPWHLEKAQGTIRRPAPLLGEHNEYIYGEILGLCQEEIQRLQSEKVIY